MLVTVGKGGEEELSGVDWEETLPVSAGVMLTVGAVVELAAAGGLTATLDADCEVLWLDEAGTEVAAAGGLTATLDAD
jgi:hypothetical protein